MVTIEGLGASAAEPGEGRRPAAVAVDRPGDAGARRAVHRVDAGEPARAAGRAPRRPRRRAGPGRRRRHVDAALRVLTPTGGSGRRVAPDTPSAHENPG
nr:hypothetical protein [Angustibacter aerolatus]